MADPLDFTDRYNTPLDPQNEVLYQAWLRDQSQAAGRDMSNDAYNYDMRGAFLGGAGRADNNHWPDTFKKPNHPSFSSQSMYHGADGHMGGQWEGQDGIWRFTPGPTNLQLHGPGGLQQYFQQSDPDVQLNIPEAAPPGPPVSMLDYVRSKMGTG
jgi:hypothetical protein